MRLERRMTTTTPRELGPAGIVSGYLQSGQPFDIATCMYHTGIDPFTKQPMHIARNLHDRKL